MIAVYQGILLGLFLSFFIGATFFILIETSINRGFKPALAMNLGVFLSDAVIISIAYFGTGDFLSNIISNSYFKMGGGIAFVGFGNYYIFKKYYSKQISIKYNLKYTRLFLNGFLINTLNPSVIAFWLGALVLALSYKQFTPPQTLTFFVSCLTVVITFDVLKIYFASKLKHFLNPRILRIICIATGIIFILLGLKIVFFN